MSDDPFELRPRRRDNHDWVSPDRPELPGYSTPVYERSVEESFNNDREAHALLDLINAEFQSDPMSVQCFDLRIVERVKQCVAKRKKFEGEHPWLMK